MHVMLAFLSVSFALKYYQVERASALGLGGRGCVSVY